MFGSAIDLRLMYVSGAETGIPKLFPDLLSPFSMLLYFRFGSKFRQNKIPRIIVANACAIQRCFVRCNVLDIYYLIGMLYLSWNIFLVMRLIRTHRRYIRSPKNILFSVRLCISGKWIHGNSPVNRIQCQLYAIRLYCLSMSMPFIGRTHYATQRKQIINKYVC